MLGSGVLLLLVTVPFVAAAAAGFHGQGRSDRALRLAAAGGLASAGLASVAAAAAAAGADLTLSVGNQTWLRVDAVSALVGLVVTAVAATVLRFATRNLQGDEKAWRFATAAASLLGGTLVLLSAARLSVLVIGWVVASAATLVLCGFRGDAPSRAAARKAGASLIAGDLALLIGLGVTVAVAGDPDLGEIAGAASTLADRELMTVGPASVDAGAVVAILLVIAALARAGQVPLPRWLPATVAAPTAVSALLHAGAVNAGGVLLVRTGPILDASPVAAAVLAGCAVATIAVAWPAMRARPDVKGQLAESTSAQMAFMLLACAVAAPIAALTHLAGHALYKSARFLGAGAVVERDRAGRCWPDLHRRSGVGPVAAASLAGLAVAAGWTAAARATGMEPAERWVVGAALVAAAGHAGWAIAARRSLRSVAAVATTLAALITAAGAALGAHHLLADAVPHPGGGRIDARLPLVAIVALAAGTTMLRRTRNGAAWLAAAAPATPADPARSARLRRRVAVVEPLRNVDAAVDAA